MQIGILSDTHDQILRTRIAIETFCTRGVEAIVHCGDLIGPQIVSECSVLPFYFVFGNHDCDMVQFLERAATEHGATCLGWGGEITIADKRIGITHGHLTMDLRPLLNTSPDYLLSGHSHKRRDWTVGTTRRINPGALHRTNEYSIAILDLVEDDVEFIPIPRRV